MPAFPPQGGSNGTWGTELRNFFSPLFDLVTGNRVPGTIVDADISAGAAIVDTKLATISTAGKVADAALSVNVMLENAANIVTANQRINAGLGVNIAPPATGDFAISGSVTAGTVPLARLGVRTTLTFVDVPSGGGISVTFTHGLGTDNVSVFFTGMPLINGSWQINASRPDGLLAGSQAHESPTSNELPATPASGDVIVRFSHEGAGLITHPFDITVVVNT